MVNDEDQAEGPFIIPLNKHFFIDTRAATSRLAGTLPVQSSELCYTSLSASRSETDPSATVKARSV